MTDDPTAINLDMTTDVLQITWADGHVSRYAGAYLRRICPCASCRGHAPGEVEPPTWEQVRGVRVAGLQPVGAYAVQPTFDDGHATGIYSFTWLREHCPSVDDGLDAEGRGG